MAGRVGCHHGGYGAKGEEQSRTASEGRVRDEVGSTGKGERGLFSVKSWGKEGGKAESHSAFKKDQEGGMGTSRS